MAENLANGSKDRNLQSGSNTKAMMRHRPKQAEAKEAQREQSGISSAEALKVAEPWQQALN